MMFRWLVSYDEDEGLAATCCDRLHKWLYQDKDTLAQN